MPNKDYCDDYAHRVSVSRPGTVTPIGGGIPTATASIISVLARSVGGEVFIRIDPATLADMEAGALNTGYLYPIAVEIEPDGDVIVHVTDGDRAQGGVTVL
jgi:hypothetical protein